METRPGPLEDVKFDIAKNDDYVNDNTRDIMLNDDEGKSRSNWEIFSED